LIRSVRFCHAKLEPGTELLQQSHLPSSFLRKVAYGFPPHWHCEVSTLQQIVAARDDADVAICFAGLTGFLATVLKLNPALPQVACFDTAFHRRVPEVAQAFALPHKLHDEGVRRYGFYGLSCEHIASVLPEQPPEIADGRVVVAHLGNGASLCALKARNSIASTMGFTVLDGLPMGTRCGDLDPGVASHLLQHKGMSADAVHDLLYRQSGMLGPPGVSSDFRDLLAYQDQRAQFAIEVFCYQTIRHIGSLSAALGGLDGIVFTAGVGENAAPIRTAICSGFLWMGLELDEAPNHRQGPRISTTGSRVAAYVIKSDENAIIARHTRALCGGR
jgi:acetate kinase